MRRRGFLGLVAVPAMLATTSAGPAREPTSSGTDPQPGSDQPGSDQQPKRDLTTLPTRIELPDGFQPEGIAIGPGPFAYFGSLANGDIYRASLGTGEGQISSVGPGTPTVGIKTDRLGRLFAAGGAAGDARVIDTKTGEILRSYQLSSQADTFVNDVVLTDDAAWFTNSREPFLYRLPLYPGRLPDPADVDRIELGGDLAYQDGFNVNGITETPDQAALIVVQSNTASLFRVDPHTGIAGRIDLDDEPMTDGDGLLLHGRTLFVVQNRSNQVAAVRLDPNAESGRVVDTITNDDFDVPTTIARFEKRLYLPNARFETEPQPGTPYWVTAIDLPNR